MKCIVINRYLNLRQSEISSLEDILRGKIKAWSDKERQHSKKLKDLGDVARLIESHPHLWDMLDEELKNLIQKP
jgi:hypothetical protein